MGVAKSKNWKLNIYFSKKAYPFSNILYLRLSTHFGFSLGYEIFSAPKKSNYMVQKEDER